MVPVRRRARLLVVAATAVGVLASACGGSGADIPPQLNQVQSNQVQSNLSQIEAQPETRPGPSESPVVQPESAAPHSPASAEPDPRPGAAAGTSQAGAGVVTIAFAGDVNFAERTADRLAQDPRTVFGAAAPGLAAADLTVVNLETAIATSGEPEPKSFTFRAPPAALTALRDAGVDVASMANNHGADYGAAGLQDTVAAVGESGFPVIGIGASDTQATAPFRTTLNGVDLEIFAATAVHDHTLESWTATAESPGVASAFDPRLAENVRSAAARGATVVVFLHWGTEYDSCPDSDQEQIASDLAAAGATAVIGTHAHVLQGAGWRPDGVYVAYGLSNYLWWRSFGNEQDDNGVLTLTVRVRSVVAASFAPAHLDETGVPVPATGSEADRINEEWDRVRGCTDLSAQSPG